MPTYTSIIARSAGVGLLVVGTISPAPANGQPIAGRQVSHVTIPFLASAARPGDLSYEGGECDIDRSGTSMACEFQQVFFTTSDYAPQTCLVTINRYDRTFTRQDGGRWISTTPPEGLCGVSDITTLQDDGGVRWTMETRKRASRAAADRTCRDVDERPDTLSWQNLRRPLPCAFIQPGGISR
ncbi:MAG: hypothetical protein ABI868_18855 [Acidobacteriota bacterium]